MTSAARCLITGAKSATRWIDGRFAQPRRRLGAPPMEISNEPHSTTRKRAIRQCCRPTKCDPGIRPRRYRDRQREGRSKASAPACRPMKASASAVPAAGLNESFTVRKISLRRRRRACVPRDVADDRLDHSGAPRQGASRQAVLTCASCAASRPASSRRRTARCRRRRVSFLRKGVTKSAGRLPALFFVAILIL